MTSEETVEQASQPGSLVSRGPNSTDPRWELALRVAATPGFKKAARLRNFLLYACRKAINNELDDLRELEIGRAVFERRQEYNSGDDNIVRVEARELRKRLDLYFATDGRDEPIVIRMPKGSYVPVFEPRTKEEPALSEGTPSVENGGDTAHRVENGLLVPRSSKLVLMLATSTLLFLAAALWLLGQNLQLRRNLAHAGVAATPVENSIWSRMFGTEHETYVVLADTCWLLLQDFSHHEGSLHDYVSRQYLADLKTPEMRTVASRHFTDIADAIVVGSIVRAAYPASRKLLIRSARMLETQDLKTRDLIFVGSRRSNPWVEQFEQQLPFTNEFDSQNHQPFFLNHSPQPGEPARYATKGKDGAWEETYAAVSFLPNLNRDGNVLIVEGSVAEGTEAAGDYLCNSSFTAELQRRFKLGSNDPLPHFELLLKISVLPGTPARVEYLTHRVLPD